MAWVSFSCDLAEFPIIKKKSHPLTMVALELELEVGASFFQRLSTLSVLLASSISVTG